MTPRQWRLVRPITEILHRDVARTDVELAAILGVSTAEVKSVLGALYGQHKVDFALGYVFLSAISAGQEARIA
jgi:hypothetical protein